MITLEDVLELADKRAQQYERAQQIGLAIYGDMVAGDLRNIVSMIRWIINEGAEDKPELSAPEPRNSRAGGR